MFVVIHFYFLTFILIRSVKKKHLCNMCHNLLLKYFMIVDFLTSIERKWRTLGMKRFKTLLHTLGDLSIQPTSVSPSTVLAIGVSEVVPDEGCRLKFDDVIPSPLTSSPTFMKAIFSFSVCHFRIPNHSHSDLSNVATHVFSTILRCGAVVVGRTDLTGNDAGSLSGTELNLGR